MPVILVTGTNGKSTTVRLLAAIARAAGKVAGLSSSDWVRVGDEILDRGDYSGPGGARLALRDRRVEMAVLELARGGILRRGLPIARADAAIVTNIAADHLGEYGILDADGIADAKLTVAKALHGGPLILNADDPRLAERGPRTGAPLAWFSLAPATACATGRRSRTVCWCCAGPASRFRSCPRPRSISAWAGPPATTSPTRWRPVAGAAALGLPVAAMAAALRSFGSDEADNPGRGLRRQVGGVEVLVDFAHNPHGVAAITSVVAAIPARRRLVLLGQAGDRTDAEITDLAGAVWALRPDRIVVKEMESYLRGRKAGEVPALLQAELTRLGAAPDLIAVEASETEAVRAAFAWAQPGDLLVLLSHAARARTLAFLDKLAATGWRPGDALPPS